MLGKDPTSVNRPLEDRLVKRKVPLETESIKGWGYVEVTYGQYQIVELVKTLSH